MFIKLKSAIKIDTSKLELIYCVNLAIGFGSRELHYRNTCCGRENSVCRICVV